MVESNKWALVRDLAVNYWGSIMRETKPKTSEAA